MAQLHSGTPFLNKFHLPPQSVLSHKLNPGSNSAPSNNLDEIIENVMKSLKRVEKGLTKNVGKQKLYFAT